MTCYSLIPLCFGTLPNRALRFRATVAGRAGTLLITATMKLSHQERVERFWKRVSITGKNDCWIWKLKPANKGYCQTWFGDNPCAKVHRVAWELTNGKIQNGLHVLHRCDNPPCCNPNHLFLGTQNDNNKDMALKGRGKNKMTNSPVCPNGHEYTKENTFVWGKDKERRCKICYYKRKGAQ